MTDPTNARYSQALGASHGNRGGAPVHAGQLAEAAADLRQALELEAQVPHMDIDMRVERARAAVEEVLDGVPTTHAAKLASLKTLNF